MSPRHLPRRASIVRCSSSIMAITLADPLSKRESCMESALQLSERLACQGQMTLSRLGPLESPRVSEDLCPMNKACPKRASPARRGQRQRDGHYRTTQMPPSGFIKASA